MKTELKDTLHLYLGCEGMIEKDYSQLLGISTNEDLINVVTKSGDDWINTIHFKPILRPLSSITGKELKVLCGDVYKEIYGGLPIFTDFQIVTISNEAIGCTFKDEQSDNIGFSVEIDCGVEFSTNGRKLIVRQFDCTLYLLKSGFDLFGLIESGQAIDKTKL